jgi:hypothetical protein
LPAFADGYCYSRRVIYVDQENYFGSGELDLYDSNDNLLKTQLALLYPMPIPTTNDVAELLAGPNTGILIDFIHKHVTVSAALHSCINQDCAKYGYLDLHHYASPQGLTEVVQ